MTFWNTHTSKIIFKKELEGDSRIQDALLYRNFDRNDRYEAPSNLFNQMPQAIVGFKFKPWWEGDSTGLDFKLVKLDLFVKSKETNFKTFNASCRELISGKMNKNDVKRHHDPNDALD